MNSQSIIKNLFLFLLITSIDTSFIHSMQEDDVEAPLLSYDIEDDIEAQLSSSPDRENVTGFSLTLFGELPSEVLHYVFSFIPTQDVSNFFRCLESIKQSPFEFIAEQLKSRHRKYRIDECNRIMLSKVTCVPTHDLANSILSFMSTTKNNDYSWYEGYALHQLIPKYKRIINFPKYKTIKKSTQAYLQEILIEFDALKNDGATNFSHQYIDLHMHIVGAFLERLREYSNFLTVDTIKIPCCNKCSLGPVDFREPMSFYPTMFCIGVAITLISGMWFFTPLPWYYVAGVGCSGLGCMSIPCCLKKKIADENKKYAQTHKQINKAIRLLKNAKAELRELKKSANEEIVEFNEDESYLSELIIES